MIIIVICVMLVVFLLLWAFIDIVPQAEARVIERLGMFRAVWGAGIHVKLPIIDKAVVPHIDLREQILELPTVTQNSVDQWENWDEELEYKESGNHRPYAQITRGTGEFSYNSADKKVRAELRAEERGYGSEERAVPPRFGKGKRRFSNRSTIRNGETTYSDYRDVITKDNVRMHVDAAVFYQVTDPKQYAYGMKQPLFALQKLTITSLRNIIGTLELDETLSSRDYINSTLRTTLDEATDSWGLKITRVEIENILPPPQMQAAMEKQATAEREKRATILMAEGQKQAAILAAEAEKQKKILEAEGLLREKELEARGLKALNENAPNDAVIRLKAIQAMEEVADGHATKIIIPSEMQGLVGLANGITEGVTPSTKPIVK